MPPKINFKTLLGKRDNAIHALKELFEEFETVFEIQPQLKRLEQIFTILETKYRSIKEQQELIADKYVEGGVEETLKEAHKRIGDAVKEEYLKISKRFAAYQKEVSSKKPQEETETLKAMTSAVLKMTETMSTGSKPSKSGLERLPVPSWDGSRRMYPTWRKEFNHWMKKYAQDEDEQLQRFRKALPSHLWWTDQVKTCKTIDQAWKILDIEFSDKRKLMDELLAGISKHDQVKRDSKSLIRYATTISSYVNDMEANDCMVTSSSEAPFFMSQLLSKLTPSDNAEFGREMKRNKKEESVLGLVEWLYEEAALRSRGKLEYDNESAEQSRRVGPFRKLDTRNLATEIPEDATCPFDCPEEHLLAACPIYKKLTVNQRWDIVQQNKRCRKCLRASHHTRDCKKPDGTSCDKCKKNHHKSLHNERNGVPPLNPSAAPFSVQERAISQNHNIEGIKHGIGLCPIQKVKVKDADGNFVEMLALLDTGSNTSLLSKKAAMKLVLTGSQIHLTMNLAGGEKRSEDSEILEIAVVSCTEEDIEKTVQVYTVKKPCNSAKTVSKNSIESYPHLKSISEKLHLSGGAVDLLIGTDLAVAFVDVHTISGRCGEPIAKRNCFGWYIIGQLDPKIPDGAKIQSVDVSHASVMENVNQLLQQDQIGIKPTRFCTCSESELRESKFVKSVSQSTTLVNGRIQVKMPWNGKGPPKQSNYDIAVKRMQSAERSFEKKGCIDVVDEEVKKLVDQAFVIKVPPEPVNHTQAEWYLPLQAVFTPEKTTKVRLVFDSSCKGHDGLSLNDRLEKGPNYINQLPNVLTAWRWDEVAYSGDVRKMFNQIMVHPEDQIYHRFLWRSKLSDTPTVYQWLRLSFGDKPAPDIAANSINTLAKASLSEFPDASKELREHAYVDDIAGSKPTAEKAKRVIDEIDIVLGKGQFQIKTWHSNHEVVDRSNHEQFTDLLGHKWDKRADRFSFKKQEIIGQLNKVSKRNCLAFLAQLWDPLGLVSPIMIKFRIDLQELWSAGFSWDEILPPSVQTKWIENVESMNQLLTFEFDRKLKLSNAVGNPEVHGFSDGGEQAFGGVIFLRWELDDGSYRCVAVMVKPFVAPLKKKSIPRLELLGCLALSRMYDTCRKALEFVNMKNFKRIFWIDSTTVLSWVRTPPRQFKPFVSSRVAEIQETIGTEDFRYVRSKSNPADGLTRGIEPAELANWLAGPSFLKFPEAQWPEFHEDLRLSNSVCQETMKEKKSSFSSNCNKEVNEVNVCLATEEKNLMQTSITRTE